MPAGAQEWKTKCLYGRACIYHTAEQVWNADRCGSQPVNDHYYFAKAHGNTFRVYYQDGRWDEVKAWTDRGLDQHNLAVRLDVFC